MSLKETLNRYAKSNIYPFHMPGHKRNLEGCYKIDMTEVEGVDDLHDPTGVIAEEQKRLANLYGANDAFILVGGSTVGNLSAVYASCNEGDLILIQRNSHKSVYNAAMLRHLKVDYIYSAVDENGIYRAATLDDIKAAVSEQKKPKAIVITSPTYEGYYCNVAEIADYCKKEGIILIVDEAHGAHLGFNETFVNQSAGIADITITSLHKTLPCLTQTAAMLVSSNQVSVQKIKDALDIFETSSPSYVLMNSVSECLDFLEQSGDLFEQYVDNLSDFYRACGNLKKLKVINEPIEKKDLGKIIISTKHTNISGTKLAAILRNEYQLETELSSFSYLLAMTSVMDTKEGFSRLKEALIEIDEKLENGFIDVPTIKQFNPNKRYELWEAKTKETRLVEMKDACGQTSGSMICLYPPGAPVVVPGEEITSTTIEIIQDALAAKIHVTGLAEGRICVVN